MFISVFMLAARLGRISEINLLSEFLLILIDILANNLYIGVLLTQSTKQKSWAKNTHDQVPTTDWIYVLPDVVETPKDTSSRRQ